MPYTGYLCGCDRVNERVGNKERNLLQGLGNRVKVGTVLVEKAVVVRIQPLGMVGRRVREEEPKRRGVMVEDLRIRRPRYDPMLFAYQSYGFALPGIVSNSQRAPRAPGVARGHTRYWPSRRVSRLSTHDQ
jgi:hypothetical protein